MQWLWQSLTEQLKVKGPALQITAGTGELKLLLASVQGLQSYFSSCSLSQLVFLVSFSSKGYYDA